MEYPQVYRNEDGVELEARDDVQAAAFVVGGFKLVEEPTKRTRKPKTDE
ncbi:hypothetical protein [Paenibacillus sp. Soil724D2]|nr:hypothetical protein [Paenibacillus sp. Soil724D2]